MFKIITIPTTLLLLFSIHSTSSSFPMPPPTPLSISTEKEPPTTGNPQTGITGRSNQITTKKDIEDIGLKTETDDLLNTTIESITPTEKYDEDNESATVTGNSGTERKHVSKTMESKKNSTKDIIPKAEYNNSLKTKMESIKSIDTYDEYDEITTDKISPEIDIKNISNKFVHTTDLSKNIKSTNNYNDFLNSTTITKAPKNYILPLKIASKIESAIKTQSPTNGYLVTTINSITQAAEKDLSNTTNSSTISSEISQTLTDKKNQLKNIEPLTANNAFIDTTAHSMLYTSEKKLIGNGLQTDVPDIANKLTTKKDLAHNIKQSSSLLGITPHLMTSSSLEEEPTTIPNLQTTNQALNVIEYIKPEVGDGKDYTLPSKTFPLTTTNNPLTGISYELTQPDTETTLGIKVPSKTSESTEEESTTTVNHQANITNKPTDKTNLLKLVNPLKIDPSDLLEVAETGWMMMSRPSGCGMCGMQRPVHRPVHRPVRRPMMQHYVQRPMYRPMHRPVMQRPVMQKPVVLALVVPIKIVKPQMQQQQCVHPCGGGGGGHWGK